MLVSTFTCVSRMLKNNTLENIQICLFQPRLAAYWSAVYAEIHLNFEKLQQYYYETKMSKEMLLFYCVLLVTFWNVCTPLRKPPPFLSRPVHLSVFP